MEAKFNVSTEREEEILSKAFEDLIQDLIRSQELTKALISNTDYILWLENFTIANPAFGDDNWLYCPEELSQEDSKRVDELTLFFNGIKEYAERNFISLFYDEYGSYTFIKFNNIGYKIGTVIGQGSVTYCERFNISSDDDDFIDFNDVVNNKKQENVDYIAKKLDTMAIIIEDLLEIGVSAEVISRRVQNVLNKDDEFLSCFM